MEFGGRFAGGRFQRPEGFRTFSTGSARPTITAPGSIDVDTFIVGAVQTISPGTALPVGGGTITYEVRHLVGSAVRSSAAGYAHAAQDADALGIAQWRAVETGGSNPGVTNWQTVASGVVAHAISADALTWNGEPITWNGEPIIFNAA